jgi:hypothetical protein
VAVNYLPRPRAAVHEQCHGKKEHKLNECDLIQIKPELRDLVGRSAASIAKLQEL